MSKLLLKNICKKYDDESYAVKNFNLEVDDKDFVILVGPSGCGKSTTLRMIAGLEEISEGEMWLDGKFANYLTHKERDLSMVFQNYALYPTMSVYDNIAFSLKVRKVPRNTIKEKVNKVAEILGIQQLLKRMPKELSGGQKQRVAIASAIIRNPKILLMDEPLSNLDAKLRNHMRVEMSKLHKKLNNTIIYVTHDQTEALTMGDRIVVLDKGIIQQAGKPEEIYYNPANTFVGGFLGSPSMNFIPCKVQDSTVKLNNEYIVYLSEEQKSIIKDRTEVLIGIRPEKMDVINANYNFTVPVDISEMLGSEKIVYFNVNGAKCSAKVDTQKHFDKEITLQFNTNDFLFFDVETGKRI